MTKLGTIFWLGLVLTSGFATYRIKYAVQGIEDDLAKVRKQTVAEQQEIRVLTAEWTYLNQPERLAQLNRRFLQLAPITARQLQQRIEDIPLRVPAATPDIAVAASPAPVAAAVSSSEPASQAAPTPAVATASAVPPVRLAKAAQDAPPTLDALFAQIADKR